MRNSVNQNDNDVLEPEQKKPEVYNTFILLKIVDASERLIHHTCKSGSSVGCTFSFFQKNNFSCLNLEMESNE